MKNPKAEALKLYLIQLAVNFLWSILFFKMGWQCSSLDLTAMVSGISPDKRICQNRSGSCKTSDPVSDMADICSIFKYSHCAAQVKKPLGQHIAVLRLNNHTLITLPGLVYINT